MRFTATPIEGAFLVELQTYCDERGFFARAWCAQQFAEVGLANRVAQANLSYSRAKGTLRGLHYQVSPYPEAKTIRCIRGAVYDVIVDMRPASSSYGLWFGVELSATERNALFVPEGCAHGYQALVDDSEVFYLASAPYTAQAERGVRFDDPALNIEWRLPVSVIAEKDRNWPDIEWSVTGQTH